MRMRLGRHVYGLAAIAFGVITLVWHDFNGWQQIRALGTVPHREILVYLAAAIELFGGIAIQWPRTARAGAFALGILYLIFALLWVPHIVATPQIYDRWGNFFEQFSIVSGALIVYATFGHCNSERAGWLARIGYVGFGICVVSFTPRTARLSVWNGKLRSEVDSSGTNVLGDNDDHCIGARSHCATFRTLGSSGVAIIDSHADRLRFAGMAAGAFRRST